MKKEQEENVGILGTDLNKNKLGYKIDPIDGTPFAIVTEEEATESKLVMGNYVLKTGSEKELYETVEGTDWKIITSFVGIMIETILKVRADGETNERVRTPETV